jgi:hypothetical protein
VFQFFSLQLNFFLSVFHISPPPVSSSCSPFPFLLSIYLAHQSRSLCLASKCLEYASLCYTLPYWTTPDDHLYFSNRRRLRLDALYHHLSSPPSFPQSNCYSIDVLSTIHRFILPCLHSSLTPLLDVFFVAMLLVYVQLRLCIVCSTVFPIDTSLCDCLLVEIKCLKKDFSFCVDFLSDCKRVSC